MNRSNEANQAKPESLITLLLKVIRRLLFLCILLYFFIPYYQVLWEGKKKSQRKSIVMDFQNSVTQYLKNLQSRLEQKEIDSSIPKEAHWRMKNEILSDLFSTQRFSLDHSQENVNQPPDTTGPSKYGLLKDSFALAAIPLERQKSGKKDSKGKDIYEFKETRADEEAAFWVIIYSRGGERKPGLDPEPLSFSRMKGIDESSLVWASSLDTQDEIDALRNDEKALIACIAGNQFERCGFEQSACTSIYLSGQVNMNKIKKGNLGVFVYWMDERCRLEASFAHTYDEADLDTLTGNDNDDSMDESSEMKDENQVLKGKGNK